MKRSRSLVTTTVTDLKIERQYKPGRLLAFLGRVFPCVGEIISQHETMVGLESLALTEPKKSGVNITYAGKMGRDLGTVIAHMAYSLLEDMQCKNMVYINAFDVKRGNKDLKNRYEKLGGSRMPASEWRKFDRYCITIERVGADTTAMAERLGEARELMQYFYDAALEDNGELTGNTKLLMERARQLKRWLDDSKLTEDK